MHRSRAPTTRIRTVANASTACMAALVAVYLLLIVRPQPFFAHRTVHGIYHAWSDEPIPPQIRSVLDDVTRRLRASTLHDPKRPVEIYICNAPWRMWVYGMQFSTRYGGIADAWLTRFLAGEAALDPARSTLYLAYHLRVAWLLDRRHWTLEQLFDHPPAEAELDGWLRAGR